jgi:hypothetical protein
MTDEIKKQYSFIQDEISEARLYRQRNVTSKMTMDDAANFAFLNTLLLYILYSEYATAPSAMSYADRTIRYQNFNRYKAAGTDLYFAYYTLLGNDGKEASMYGGTDKFFNDMAEGRLDPRFVQRFFLRLERGLGISTQNYRSIRRLAMDWTHLNDMEKKLCITRMVQYFRAGYRRAELYPQLEMLASGGYQLQGAKNAEKKGLGTGAKAAAAFVGGYAAAQALSMLGGRGYKSLQKGQDYGDSFHSSRKG